MAAARTTKNYEALAKKNIVRPSDIEPKRRFFIYSRNKKGKTRFCLTAPDVLVVDPEHGTDQYRRVNPAVWHVTRWEQIDDIWGYLRLGKHPYKWVALDGMTKINNLALRFIMRRREEETLEQRPGIVDRRDYNKSGELIKEMVLRFDRLPLGVIYTAQERQMSGDDDDETSEATTRYVPDVPQGVRGTINGVVDVIGRIYTAKAQFKNPDGGDPIEKNQRRMWIGDHAQYDTGYRSEYALPDMVKNPTVPTLVDLIAKGE